MCFYYTIERITLSCQFWMFPLNFCCVIERSNCVTITQSGICLILSCVSCLQNAKLSTKNQSYLCFRKWKAGENKSVWNCDQEAPAVTKTLIWKSSGITMDGLDTKGHWDTVRCPCVMCYIVCQLCLKAVIFILLEML